MADSEKENSSGECLGDKEDLDRFKIPISGLDSREMDRRPLLPAFSLPPPSLATAILGYDVDKVGKSLLAYRAS